MTSFCLFDRCYLCQVIDTMMSETSVVVQIEQDNLDDATREDDDDSGEVKPSLSL